MSAISYRNQVASVRLVGIHGGSRELIVEAFIRMFAGIASGGFWWYRVAILVKAKVD